jgi:hypothetical protein
MVFGLAKFLAQDNTCNTRLTALHASIITIIHQAQSFSEGARMKVAFRIQPSHTHT